MLVERGVSHLICGDINPEAAEKTVERARELDKTKSLSVAIAVKTDVSEESDVQALFNTAVASAGRIEICVNTAGVGYNLIDMIY